MTVPDLITCLMRAIYAKFYQDPPRGREFKRDEKALHKAIARYGYECHRRGWEFDVQHILHAIMALPLDIQKRQGEIKYLPVYLQSTVDQHIRERAEELSQKAKAIAPKVAQIVKDTRAVEAVREPSPTEILAALYRDLKRPRKKKATAPQQRGLL